MSTIFFITLQRLLGIFSKSPAPSSTIWLLVFNGELGFNPETGGEHTHQRSRKSSPNVAVGISFVLDYACPLDVTIESIPTLGVCTTMDTLVDFEAYPLVIIVVDVHPSLDRESSVPHPMIVVASSYITRGLNISLLLIFAKVLITFIQHAVSIFLLI